MSTSLLSDSNQLMPRWRKARRKVRLKLPIDNGLELTWNRSKTRGPTPDLAAEGQPAQRSSAKFPPESVNYLQSFDLYPANIDAPRPVLLHVLLFSQS